MSFRDSLKFKGSNATQILRDQHFTTVSMTEDFLSNNLSLNDFLKHVDYTIKVHFPLEEEILIPAFRPYLRQYMEFEEPIRIITSEHRSINGMYMGINSPRSYEVQDDPAISEEEKISQTGHIAKIMLQHIYKEENGLFNLVELYLPDELKTHVFLDIKSRFSTLEASYKEGP